jgi:predicted outer membrane protein
MKTLRWFCPLTLVAAMVMPTALFAQGQRPAPPSQTPQPPGQQPQQPGQQQAGQQQQPGQQQPGQRQQGQYEANDELVNYLAANLFLANKAEVAFSQAAMDKLTAQPLKQFAQKVAQGHQQLNQQLLQAMPALQALDQIQLAGGQQADGQQAGGQQAGGQQAGGQQAGGQQAGGQQADWGTDEMLSQLRQDGFLDGAALRLLSIKKRAMENQFQMTQQMLDQHSGQDYAMGFLGNQIVAHTWMAAELDAVEGIGPQSLQQIVQQTKQAVNEHLETAKQFAEQIENDRAKQGQAQQQSGEQSLRR